MKTCYAVVHKDENSAYGVSFPDAAGCFSAADDLDDLVTRASEALELWCEGAAIPEPSSMTDIRAQAAEELAQGAFLIAVPLIRRVDELQRSG